MEGTYYVLKRPNQAPKRVPIADCWRVQTMDPADSEKDSADWTVISTWAITPQREVILLHVERARSEGPDVLQLVRDQFSTWKPQFIAIERNGLGRPIVRDLLREGYPIRPVWRHRDKVAMAHGPAARYQSGVIYHPQDMPEWCNLFERELLSFPNGAHDDSVDTLSTLSEIILPENSLFSEYNPRFHAAPEDAEPLEEVKVICGWADQPYLSVVVGQQDDRGRFRCWLAGAINDGEGVGHFIEKLARGIKEMFADPYGKMLNEIEVEHYGPVPWFGRAPTAMGRTVREVLRDGGPDGRSFDWFCQQGAESREEGFALIRKRLSLLRDGEPALSLGKGSGRVADALLGGCRYKRGQNGEIMPEPEPNRELAIMEALGHALSRQELVSGENYADYIPPHDFGRPGAGSRDRL